MPLSYCSVSKAAQKGEGAVSPAVAAPAAAIWQLCCAQDQLRTCVCLMHCPHA